MGRQGRRWALWAVLGWLATLGPAWAEANAQQPTTRARADAIAVVEGVVREVFRSRRQGRTDILVQIDVRRSELNDATRDGARPGVACPPPGESVYVHLTQNANIPAPAKVPAELSQVRAYLVPRAGGGWAGTSPDWFDVTSERRIARGPDEPPPPTDEPNPGQAPAPSPPATPATPRGKVAVQGLGVSAEPIEVQGRPAFRVTGVDRGGPAQRAGIEVGDVIAGAGGKPLASLTQLDELSRKGGPLTLDVVDVNTGKTVPVEVITTAQTPDTPANSDPSRPRVPDPSPSPSAPSHSLGISTEPVSVGGRTALKVVRVKPESPAARSGLEVGDVLVAANGAAITGPEQLAAALRKSGPILSLTVRDVRTGKDTPVEVAFDAPGKAALPGDIPALPGGPVPANVPGEAGSRADRLGAVTELTFFDVEVAVKVTEVTPGGPAARAGIQVGTIIVKADGKPVLHPNDLVEATRKAANSIRLTIADPQSGKTSDVDVDLRGR